MNVTVGLILFILFIILLLIAIILLCLTYILIQYIFSKDKDKNKNKDKNKDKNKNKETYIQTNNNSGNYEHFVESSEQQYERLPVVRDRPQVINNFITPEEAEYIKNLVYTTGGFGISEVIGQYGIENIEKYRKSETKWLNKYNDEVVKKIITKACQLTGSIYDNCEELQVVRYEAGGFFREHNDNCCDDTPSCVEFKGRGGMRVLTILISLSDPSEFEGGETRFTQIDYSYKGNKGDAVLFYNLTENNECNPLATHGGEPLTSGEKWIANVWIRQEKFT